MFSRMSSRQGCGSSGVRVLTPSITCSGRLAYSVRAEATKHVQPERKSLGCPVREHSGGNDLGGEQTRRPEHKEMSATSKNMPRKVVFAEQSRKPTQFLHGEGR
jgi:hypothetical protein